MRCSYPLSGGCRTGLPLWDAPITCFWLPLHIWFVSNSLFFLLKTTLKMAKTRRAAPQTVAIFNVAQKKQTVRNKSKSSQASKNRLWVHPEGKTSPTAPEGETTVKFEKYEKIRKDRKIYKV